MTFGQKMLAIRKAKGIQQKQIAEATGLRASALSRYENTDLRPRAKTVRMIADALDVPVSELLTDGPYRHTRYRKHPYALRLHRKSVYKLFAGDSMYSMQDAMACIECWKKGYPEILIAWVEDDDGNVIYKDCSIDSIGIEVD